MSENRICLGKIVGAHGIKGEVKIKSFTEDPEDIVEYGELGNKDGSKKYSIKLHGFSKGTLRASFKGCDDRSMAEALTGTELWISKDVLPELEDDEFYHRDLVGLDVKLEETNEVLGQIIGIYDFGAGDLIEMKVSKTNKDAMFPFKEEFVPEVNIKQRYVVVKDIILDFIDDSVKKKVDDES